MIVSGGFEFEVDKNMSACICQIEDLHILDAHDRGSIIDDINKIENGFKTDLVNNSYMTEYIKSVCTDGYVRVFVRLEWSYEFKCYVFDYGIEDITL